MLDLQISNDTISMLHNLVKVNGNNAFIIHGARGIGKRAVIEQFIKAHLNINVLLHHNLLFLDAKDSKVTSEIVRNINDFAYKTSYDNQSKLVVIDNVDRLNIFSHNALLKILEEQINNNVFVLISSRYQSLPPTIKSRCISIRCLPPNIKTSLEIIKNQFPELNSEEIKQYNYLSNNSPFFAISMIHDQKLKHYDSILETIRYLNSDPTKFFKMLDSLSEQLEANQWSHMLNHIISTTIKRLLAEDLSSPIENEAEVIKLILAKHKSVIELLNLEQQCRELLSSQEKTHLNIKTVVILIIYKAIYL